MLFLEFHFDSLPIVNFNYLTASLNQFQTELFQNEFGSHNKRVLLYTAQNKSRHHLANNPELTIAYLICGTRAHGAA